MAGETENAAAAAAAAAAVLAPRATSFNQNRPAASTALGHSIDKLDGTMATGKSNYKAWRFRLVRILNEKDLHTVVSELPLQSTLEAEASTATAAGKTPPPSPELAEFNIKDNQAFTIITLNIKDSQVPHIQRCTTAKEAWDSLREVHQGKGTDGRMILTQRLWSLRLKEGEDMASHLNVFREIANQIENLSNGDGGSQIRGIDLISMLSLSLPDLYEPLIMALQSRSEQPTFDFMAGRLLQESLRRQAAHSNGNTANTGHSVFIAGGTGKRGGRGGNFRGNQSPRGTQFRGRGPTSFGTIDVGQFKQKKPEGPCFSCNKEGHWKRDGDKRKADEAGGKTEEQEKGPTAFAAIAAKTGPSSDWIIDSGASQHLSAQHNWFINYQLISTIKIQIGDGSEIEAIGKGDIVLTIATREITLHDVLHVPMIGSNLLLVAKIVDHGHILVFSTSGCQIWNDNGLRKEGIREGNV